MLHIIGYKQLCSKLDIRENAAVLYEPERLLKSNNDLTIEDIDAKLEGLNYYKRKTKHKKRDNFLSIQSNYNIP